MSSPSTVLLADQYLDRRQVVCELCRRYISCVIGVAVHLHTMRDALIFWSEQYNLSRTIDVWVATQTSVQLSDDAEDSYSIFISVVAEVLPCLRGLYCCQNNLHYMRSSGGAARRAQHSGQEPHNVHAAAVEP